jgi:hypothetical protein
VLILYINLYKMEKKSTPLKAIKEYCKNQCCAGDTISWRECTFTDCPLWKYRFGKKIKK